MGNLDPINFISSLFQKKSTNGQWGWWKRKYCWPISLSLNIFLSFVHKDLVFLTLTRNHWIFQTKQLKKPFVQVSSSHFLKCINQSQIYNRLNDEHSKSEFLLAFHPSTYFLSYWTCHSYNFTFLCKITFNFCIISLTLFAESSMVSKN